MKMNNGKKRRKTKLTMHADNSCDFSGKMHLGFMLRKKKGKIMEDAYLFKPTPNVGTNFQRRAFLLPFLKSHFLDH